jgi:dihydrofolate reductase
MTTAHAPLSLIVAVAENGCIGVENKLPWHLPEDLKRFREITRGHPVIMGRKTFESIGRPLPQRQNIVITRDPSYSAPGIQAVTSLEQAIELASATNPREIFVIGGAEIYRLAFPRADRLYLTVVHLEVRGDAFFPEWSSLSRQLAAIPGAGDWQEDFREKHRSTQSGQADQAGQVSFTYLNLQRRVESPQEKKPALIS